MNLKILISLILLLQVFTIFSQNRKIETSLDYSIGQSFRRFKSGNLILPLEDLEVPISTHGINVQVKYILTERLGIVSGLGYNQHGEETNETNMILGEMVDPIYGFIYDTISATTPTSVRIKYVYDFLTIPLLINYSVINRKKSDLDIQIGGTFNYLIGSRTISKTEYSDGKKERRSNNYDFNSNEMNFAGLFEIYYKRKLGDRYFLKVGPQINYFFTSITNSSLVKHYPYRTSINLGIGF